MRRLCVPLAAAFVFWTQPGAAAEPSDPNMSYPGAVALSQDSNGDWGYKSFPKLLPLYIFKGEPPGRSLCDRDCTAVWPIVEAHSNDEPVGFWSIVKRDDGRLQWAYKKSPVYTYFEDRPNEPKGAGKSMDWYLVEQSYVYLEGIGWRLSPVSTNAAGRNGKKIKATAQLLEP